RDVLKMITIPSNMGCDLHNLEHMNDADLVLFVAGNQFMAMEELLSAFKEETSESKIFYETLPPGMELRQILKGGAIFSGTVIDVIPDVYASVSLDSMKKLEEKGLIEKGDYFLYLHNRLVLMIPKGNPAGITSVEDLGRDDVRVSQPNPETEDIGPYITDMYKDAGGEKLVHRIMEEKRAEGTSIMTIVHHRETPLRIGKGTVDVGPVWATEVLNAIKQGMKVEMIEPGPKLDQRDAINYYMARLKRAPHPKRARVFLDFIKSERAQKIYERYGFVPEKVF
ncbi:MAG: substrate-binding domain-containing protein, partial [Candidatus Hydrothermarchaeaceae archaeon]